MVKSENKIVEVNDKKKGKKASTDGLDHGYFGGLLLLNPQNTTLFTQNDNRTSFHI